MTSTYHEIRRFAAACAGLALCLCNASCWMTMHNRAGGDSLLERPVIVTPSVHVAVEKFWINQVQGFDYESTVHADTIVTRWKEMPGQTDVTYDVVEALKEVGHQTVGATGDPEAEYRIVGFLDRKEVTPGGWIIYNSLMAFPGLFLPVPFKGGDFEGRIGLSIYDRNGRRVASRTTFYGSAATGLWLWGGLESTRGEEPYAACANIATQMIEGLADSRP